MLLSIYLHEIFAGKLSHQFILKIDRFSLNARNCFNMENNNHTYVEKHKKGKWKYQRERERERERERKRGIKDILQNICYLSIYLQILFLSSLNYISICICVSSKSLKDKTLKINKITLHED